MTDQAHAGYTNLARQILPELLRHRGVESRLDSDGTVRLPRHGLRVDCTAYEEASLGAALHVRLDFGLMRTIGQRKTCLVELSIAQLDGRWSTTGPSQRISCGTSPRSGLETSGDTLN